MNDQPVRLTNDMYMPSSSFGVFHTLNSTPTELHWHEFYEMSFIIAGTGRHELNGSTLPLVPGSLFLLSPADFHAVYPDSDCPLEIGNVIFAADKLPEELRQALFGVSAQSGPITLTLAGDEAAAMTADYLRLHREYVERELGSTIVIQGMLERMLVDVARRSGRSSAEAFSAESRQQYAVRQALLYMQHHFRDKLTLQSVAGHVGLSAHYFSECFHKATGYSFQSFLQLQRIQFAKALLRSSTLAVTDICFASGFHSLPHFEKAFKQKTGVSPRDYRKG
ncbi:MAG: helix-turn-helix domain-containing protein [Paenibacillaceae bacterium]|nr:helix-turn-helix domain-containing protein [Paenibacillaceae bacterium]